MTHLSHQGWRAKNSKKREKKLVKWQQLERERFFYFSVGVDITMFTYIGKSLSEALIFASINPQYGNRLFMELP